MVNSNRLTTISISYENYYTLKRLGGAGDSFNDVLTNVLKKLSLQQTESGLGLLNQSAAERTTQTIGDGKSRWDI